MHLASRAPNSWTPQAGLLRTAPASSPSASRPSFDAFAHSTAIGGPERDTARIGMVCRSGQDDTYAPSVGRATTMKQMTSSTVTGVIAYRSTLL